MLADVLSVDNAVALPIQELLYQLRPDATAYFERDYVMVSYGTITLCWHSELGWQRAELR